MDILFSIVVPVYNVEEYLEECIQSIQKQTYSHFEIVLIDDGSTDSSGNICDYYGKTEDNIQVIHQNNGGLSKARNVGMRYAKGDYVIFVDSDDYIANNVLQKMFEAIKEGTKPDIVLPNGWYKVYENNISLEDTLEIYGVKAEISGMQALNSYLKSQISGWTACGKCFSRKFWQENNFTFQPGIYYEDVQLIYKVIAKAKRVKIVPAGYYYRKIRQNSILSKPKAKLIRDYIVILAEWNDYLEYAGYEKQTNELIKKVFAGEYVTSILPSIPFFDKDEKRQLIESAKQIQYYLTYSDNYLVKLTRISSKVFGFSLTCKILYFLKIIKGKVI